jgi:hypothetical protein
MKSRRKLNKTKNKRRNKTKSKRIRIHTRKTNRMGLIRKTKKKGGTGIVRGIYETGKAVDRSGERILYAAADVTEGTAIVAARTMSRGPVILGKIVNFALNLTEGAVLITNGILLTSVAITMGCARILHDSWQSTLTELESCPQMDFDSKINYKCLFDILKKKNEMILSTKKTEISSIISTGKSMGKLIDISLKELGCSVPYYLPMFYSINCKTDKVKDIQKDKLQAFATKKKLILEELKKQLDLLYTKESSQIKVTSSFITTTEDTADDFSKKKSEIKTHLNALKTPYDKHNLIVKIVGENGSLMIILNELKKLKDAKDAEDARKFKNAENAKNADDSMEPDSGNTLPKKLSEEEVKISTNKVIKELEEKSKMITPENFNVELSKLTYDTKKIEDEQIKLDKLEKNIANNLPKNVNSAIVNGTNVIQPVNKEKMSKVHENIQKRFDPNLVKNIQGRKLMNSKLIQNIQTKFTNKITPNTLKKIQNFSSVFASNTKSE